jgi:hypothetical protein
VTLLICRNATHSAVEQAACRAIGQEKGRTTSSYGLGFRHARQFAEPARQMDGLNLSWIARPSWPTRTRFLVAACRDVPLGRARAKNLGPLQAVPVMARAMAERLA